MSLLLFAVNILYSTTRPSVESAKQQQYNLDVYYNTFYCGLAGTTVLIFVMVVLASVYCVRSRKSAFMRQRNRSVLFDSRRYDMNTHDDIRSLRSLAALRSQPRRVPNIDHQYVPLSLQRLHNINNTHLITQVDVNITTQSVSFNPNVSALPSPFNPDMNMPPPQYSDVFSIPTSAILYEPQGLRTPPPPYLPRSDNDYIDMSLTSLPDYENVRNNEADSHLPNDEM